jgi:hypothetical protein
VCGIPIVALKYRKRALVPAIFAAAFYVSIGAGRTVFFRYAMPLLPVACVFAAVTVRAAAERLSRRTAIQASSIGRPRSRRRAVARQSIQLDRVLARQIRARSRPNGSAGSCAPTTACTTAAAIHAAVSPGTYSHECRSDPPRIVRRSGGARMPD